MSFSMSNPPSYSVVLEDSTRLSNVLPATSGSLIQRSINIRRAPVDCLVYYIAINDNRIEHVRTFRTSHAAADYVRGAVEYPASRFRRAPNGRILTTPNPVRIEIYTSDVEFRITRKSDSDSTLREYRFLLTTFVTENTIIFLSSVLLLHPITCWTQVKIKYS